MKLNKWINPSFWGHPTPVNLMIIILGVGFLLYIVAWVAWLITKLPWPVF